MGASATLAPARYCWFGTLVTLLGLSSGAAAQEQALESPTPCSPTAANITTGMTELACQLVSQLPPLPDVRVMTLPLLGADDAQQARFGRQFSALVASALGATNAGFAKTIHEAPGGSTPDTSLLLLEPHLRGGKLGITANATSASGSFWARVRGDQARVLAHSYVETPLDVELRSFFPPVPLVRPTVAAYSQPLPSANAVACGDVNGDGALDVALSDRQRILLGYLTQEGYQTTHEARWSALSDVAAVPLRETLAAVFIGRDSVTASSSDRRLWVRLDDQLRLLEAHPGWLAAGSDVCVPRAPFSEQEVTHPCTQAAPSQGNQPFQAFDRVVTFDTAEARPTRLTAWRDPATATLQVRVEQDDAQKGQGYQLQYPSVGAQVAVADLNLDGQAELVASSDSLNASHDELHVWPLLRPATGAAPPGAAPAAPPVWTIPIPTGVQAVGVCPADELGPAATLVVSGEQLLVVR